MTLFALIALFMLLVGSVATLFPEWLPAGVAGCLVTKGLPKSCGMRVGGIDEMYIGNWDDLDPAFASTGVNWAPDGSIVTLMMQNGKKIFRYDFETNTAGFNQELQTGANRYLNVSVNLQIGGISQANNQIMNVLAVGKVFVICRLRGSGRWIALGLPNKEGKGTYLTATTLTGNSGLAEGDLEGWNIVLGGPQVFYANQTVREAFAAHIFSEVA